QASTAMTPTSGRSSCASSQSRGSRCARTTSDSCARLDDVVARELEDRELALARVARAQHLEDRDVEHGAATGDTAHRVGEVVDVGDTLFQQVADSVRLRREQLDGALHVEVRRVQEDAGL